MQPVIYDVAISADGFICGADGDIALFPHDGPMVDDYLARLGGYAVALMGRRTYTFAYADGLTPGANPYPHMRTVVVSGSLDLPADAAVEHRRAIDAGAVRALASEAAGPVYLCGGGTFAGWMVREGLIDLLRVKRAPVLYGRGVRLFQDGPPLRPRLLSERHHPGGQVFQEFDLRAAA